jgi:hypothetical protein
MSLMVIGVVIDSRVHGLCEDLCMNRAHRSFNTNGNGALFCQVLGPTTG